METCLLCHRNRNLRKSHLFPQFISDWIKSTSVTGKMRTAKKPNVRVQDTISLKLLCDECEELISVDEKYFAEKVFKPVMCANNPIISYNSQLNRFCVSLSWRILVFSLKKVSNRLEHSNELLIAEDNWRKLLLSEKHLDDYEHHLLMLRPVDNAPDIPNTAVNINWYLFRSVDGTIVQNSEESFVLAKLPGLAIFSTIKPKKFVHLDNTLIEDSGSLDFYSQTISISLFKYLFSRYLETLSPISQISQKQWDKIENDYMRNMDKFENSFTFQLLLRDELKINDR